MGIALHRKRLLSDCCQKASGGREGALGHGFHQQHENIEGAASELNLILAAETQSKRSVAALGRPISSTSGTSGAATPGSATGRSAQPAGAGRIFLVNGYRGSNCAGS